MSGEEEVKEAPDAAAMVIDVDRGHAADEGAVSGTRKREAPEDRDAAEGEEDDAVVAASADTAASFGNLDEGGEVVVDHPMMSPESVTEENRTDEESGAACELSQSSLLSPPQLQKGEISGVMDTKDEEAPAIAVAPLTEASRAKPDDDDIMEVEPREAAATTSTTPLQLPVKGEAKKAPSPALPIAEESIAAALMMTAMDKSAAGTAKAAKDDAEAGLPQEEVLPMEKDDTPPAAEEAVVATVTAPPQPDVRLDLQNQRGAAIELSGADEDDEGEPTMTAPPIVSALAQVLTEQHERQYVEVRQERDRLLDQLGEMQRQLASGRSDVASLQSQLQEQARAATSVQEQARRVEGLEADIRTAQERNDRLQVEGDRLREEIRYERALFRDGSFSSCGIPTSS